MLIELKRCNNIGNIEGILFLASILFNKPAVDIKEISNRVSLEKGISLNCIGAVAFFDYLGYVQSDSNRVIPTEKLNGMNLLDRECFINQMVKDCITTLTEEGIFDAGSTCFDIEAGHLSIKHSAFPLAYAAIRNFLTMVGALEQVERGEIGISELYEDDLSDLLRIRQEKITLQQLLDKQKEQNARGLAAEEFVLKYEMNRLPEKALQIKRISDFDVSAGYDIVSFDSPTSSHYDRFIEVKCYLGEPHFYWSENEADVARIKGDKYYLCLVDYQKMIQDSNYCPEYIKNPYMVIFDDDTWLVNTASYRVQKI